MSQLAESHTTVRITHHYAASPARVFDAWLAPRIAGLWLFATASRPTVNVSIAAHCGGTFCFIESRAGATIEHRGHYAEIARPQRLVLVLHSPDCAPKEFPSGGAPCATRVTAEFTACGTGCELRLRHDGLSADHAARVEARWEGMLYGLAVVLAQHDTGNRYK